MAEQSVPFLRENSTNKLFRLDARAREALAERLEKRTNVNFEEIEEVSTLSRRLFPVGLELDFRTLERFRALASFSQFQLLPHTQITSHRRFLGPIIVALKRLSWPILQVHLRKSFEGQQEFNARVVEALAHNVVATLEGSREKN